MSTYIVDLKALRTDAVQYQYELDDAFFASLDGEDVLGGQVTVRLEIKTISEGFRFVFKIEGVVTVACDRCLDDMVYPCSTENVLKVKFGENYEETEDLVTIPEEDGTINVAWNIYEFINLALPIKRVHKEGECNEQMVNKLQEYLAIEAGEKEEV